MAAVDQKFVTDQLTKDVQAGKRKVSVVGAGSVGLACCVGILNNQLCNELTVIDVIADKVKGEVMDLQHSMGAMKYPIAVNGGTDFALTRGSTLCVITAGCRQRPGETRDKLLIRNAELLGPIIKKCVEFSPNTIILIISNPCDAMTYLAWKVSGLPRNRVFGTGTSLDSSRFKHLIAERLGVPVANVHANVIGKHGETDAIPVWSAVAVGGTRLREIEPLAGTEKDPNDWNDITRQVTESAGTIIKLKGYTSWGIGLACASVCRAVLKNEPTILPVSTVIPKGSYGVPEDVCASVPCLLDSEGVRYIMKQTLDDTETKLFKTCASNLLDIQRVAVSKL